MPTIDGYGFAGAFEPTDQTGGDLYDFVQLDEHRLFLLMGDATGHGIGPALSATQVRAMLRVALRLESSLDDAFVHINDQLCDDLPDDRFVTGFFGLLDATQHKVSFHSGGQGPIMHYHAASGMYDWHPATTFPLGYLPQTDLAAPLEIDLAPGDILGLISDGIYEYENEQACSLVSKASPTLSTNSPMGDADAVVAEIMRAVRQHGGSVPQADDITIVLARRSGKAATPMQRKFTRSFDALADIYEFAEGILAAENVEDSVRFPVHLALEELYVNMVKYYPDNDNDILLDVTAADGKVSVTMTDYDVDPFDVYGAEKRGYGAAAGRAGSWWSGPASRAADGR